MASLWCPVTGWAGPLWSPYLLPDTRSPGPAFSRHLPATIFLSRKSFSFLSWSLIISLGSNWESSALTCCPKTPQNYLMFPLFLMFQGPPTLPVCLVSIPPSPVWDSSISWVDCGYRELCGYHAICISQNFLCSLKCYIITCLSPWGPSIVKPWNQKNTPCFSLSVGVFPLLDEIAWGVQMLMDSVDTEN